MFKDRIALFFIFLCIPIILTGCWDKTELEDRNFIIGIGIDKYTEENDKKEKAEKISGDENKSRYIVNLVLPNASKIDGGSNKDRNIQSAESATISEAFKMIDSYSSQEIYFGHTKVCIIGESILKDKELFKETLDLLERNREISRKLMILSCEEQTKDILSADTKNEPFVGMFLSDFYRNNVNNVGITFRKDLENVVQNVITYGNTVIPRISLKDDEIKLGGLAVIKDFEFVGWLDESQTRGYSWLSKEKMRESIETEFDNTFIPLKVINKNTKINFTEKDNKLTCNIDIDVTGSIEEYNLTENILVDTNKFNELEDKYNDVIKSEVAKTLKTLQNEYHTDAIGLNDMCRKNYYSVFKKFDNWDSAFSDMDININVNTNIKNSGNTK